MLMVLTWSAYADNGATPQITFEADAIAARVTPGAKTAWLGIVREPTGYGVRVSEHAKIEVDTDGDGIVRYALAGASQLDSVWLVVDMTSGESALEGPSMPAHRRRTLPEAALHGRGNGVSAQVRGSHEVAMLWFVRPGVGAWYATSADGALSDGDNVPDGTSTAVLASLHAVGDSPEAPDDFVREDIVVVVDPFTLTVSEARIKE